MNYDKINKTHDSLLKNKLFKHSYVLIENLKTSLEHDKCFVNNHELTNMILQNTNIIYNSLGLERINGSINDVIISKEGILDFLSTKSNFDINKSDYDEIVEYVKDNNAILTSFNLSEELIDSIESILRINNCKKDFNINNIISILEKYILNVKKYRKKYKVEDVFSFNNLISDKKMEALGNKAKDKLDILGNRSVIDVCDIDIKKIEKEDKKAGIIVDEYRFIVNGFSEKWRDNSVGIYILRYFRNKSLYLMIPRLYTFNYAINDIDRVSLLKNNLTYDDLLKLVNISEIYEETESNMDIISSDHFNEDDYDDGIEELCKYLSTLKELDIDHNKLFLENFYEFDYMNFISEWSIQSDCKTPLLNFVVDISLSNYYDNVEQGKYGHIVPTLEIRELFINAAKNIIEKEE